MQPFEAPDDFPRTNLAAAIRRSDAILLPLLRPRLVPPAVHLPPLVPAAAACEQIPDQGQLRKVSSVGLQRNTLLLAATRLFAPANPGFEQLGKPSQDSRLGSPSP